AVLAYPHACLARRSSDLEPLTMEGQRPGTPLYMSPEQVLGQFNIDERTDIFSMGVVMYEMLAYREPFRGRTIGETFDNIINEDRSEEHTSELQSRENVVC